MTTTDGEAGGHAFPCAIHEGMTLRDYFAGQVLAGQSAFQGIGATDIALAAYEIAGAGDRVYSDVAGAAVFWRVR